MFLLKNGCRLGHVIWIIFVHIGYPYRCLIQKVLIVQVVSEKMFEYYDNIRAYCPGVWQTNFYDQLGLNFVFIIII